MMIRTSAARPSLVAILLNCDNVTFIEQLLTESDLMKEKHSTLIHFVGGETLEVWEPFKAVESALKACEPTPAASTTSE